MSNSSGYGGYDALLIKTNSEGLVEWNKTYGNQFNDMAHSLIKAINGGYVFVGSTSSSMSENFFQPSDYWLVKVDSLGNYEWDQSFDNEEFDSCRSVIGTKDGGYALLGYSGTIDQSNQSFGFSNSDVWLVKVDSLGNHQWKQTYGGKIADYCDSMVNSKDGGFTLACITQTPRFGDGVFWLIQVDSVGNLLENQTYGLSAHHSHTSLLITEKNSYVLARSTRDQFGFRDFWIGEISGPNEKSTIEFLSFLLIIATFGIILYIIYKKIWIPKRAIKN